MTDTTTTPPPGGAAAVRNPAATPLVTLAQYVKDLSFENPNAPRVLTQMRQPPDVQVTVDVSARGIGEDVYETMLTLKAEAKNGEDVCFVVELSYGGVFSTKNAPKELVEPLLLIEAPRLLFPFARAIIADATRDGGFPPLLVQPVDFLDLHRRRVAAAQQAAGGAQGATAQAGAAASQPAAAAPAPSSPAPSSPAHSGPAHSGNGASKPAGGGDAASAQPAGTPGSAEKG